MTSIFCPYYESCGGCSMQHLAPEDYAIAKRGVLLNAVARLGVEEAVVAELISVGQRSRRRVDFKLAVNKGVVNLGFYAAKTHDVVAIDDCPVTQTTITQMILPLRQLFSTFKKPSLITSVNITAVEQGLDIALMLKEKLHPSDHNKLLEWCMQHPTILRLAEKIGDSIAQVILRQGDVVITLGDVKVKLPPQPFLQATSAGQNALTHLVLKSLEGHGRVVDLYSGCGTYSFPLVQRGHRVTAFEGGYDMVIAMVNAVRQYALEHQLSAYVRDLVKDPLRASELQAFDAVVINPPRNGASPQIKQIARSNLPTIVMVSCNPSTFERDAKYLLEAGYALTSATPIDQFYQTNHLELVAVFTINA